MGRPTLFYIAIILVVLAAACFSQTKGDGDLPAIGEVAELADEPQGTAGSEFWEHWGDGNAELANYEGVVSQYGELREATAFLIYVTEPVDRRTWVKSDDVEEPYRLNVVKLNQMIDFQTGIYPYSVMTSIFSPVDDWGGERFQPTKITMTAQEWCGQVFHGVWPGPERHLSRRHSYFDDPGDKEEAISTPENTLYEDALPIQFRELDGKFNNGQDWSGKIVASLWHQRATHGDSQVVDATIEREVTDIDGIPTTSFTVRYNDVWARYYVEIAEPRRILRWELSNGTKFNLVDSTRLPYWELNAPGDEKYLEEIR